MKNEKKDMEEQEKNVTGPGSNPENKFKEDAPPATAESINNIIKSPIDTTKAKSGSTLYNEGSTVDYDEER